MPKNTAEKMFKVMEEQFAPKGINLKQIAKKAMEYRIETPSWAYGNSGTRFGTVVDPSAPRNIYEKMDDASQVNKVTGIAPTIAIHILWDMVPDWAHLKKHAASRGLTIGAINPTLFTLPEYKFNSTITSPEAKVRKLAVDHMKESVAIGKELGCTLFTPWFPDGTNYPGQGNFRTRKHRALDCLREVYNLMPKNMRMLLEYKLFEPAFYHTDIADWGASLVLCQHLGDRAQVLVDLGHHAHGVNIEWIVAMLIDEGKLGGFHFNDSKYSDDDLTTGCINPFQLYLIFNELISGKADPGFGGNAAYMIDEMPATKPRIESMIQSVTYLQEAYTKALLIDQKALKKAQDENRIIDAENIVRSAYETDVRPILEVARMKQGLEPDPMEAFRSSGYYRKILRERSESPAKKKGRKLQKV